jgi:hypothetical protein
MTPVTDHRFLQSRPVPDITVPERTQADGLTALHGPPQ